MHLASLLAPVSFALGQGFSGTGEQLRSRHLLEMIQTSLQLSAPFALCLDTDSLDWALAALPNALPLKLKLIPPDNHRA
jgi:hypothetical protein